MKTFVSLQFHAWVFFGVLYLSVLVVSNSNFISHDLGILWVFNEKLWWQLLWFWTWINLCDFVFSMDEPYWLLLTDIFVFFVMCKTCLQYSCTPNVLGGLFLQIKVTSCNIFLIQRCLFGSTCLLEWHWYVL